jgi:hypothetical protein
MFLSENNCLLSGPYLPLFILHNRPFTQIVYARVNSAAASKVGFDTVFIFFNFPSIGTWDYIVVSSVEQKKPHYYPFLVVS